MELLLLHLFFVIVVDVAAPMAVAMGQEFEEFDELQLPLEIRITIFIIK